MKRNQICGEFGFVSRDAAASPRSRRPRMRVRACPKWATRCRPDFTLKYFDGSDRKDVKLSDYRGKKKRQVAFYVSRSRVDKAKCRPLQQTSKRWKQPTPRSWV